VPDFINVVGSRKIMRSLSATRGDKPTAPSSLLPTGFDCASTSSHLLYASEGAAMAAA
jgi:hypothetical protein